jgi:two-component system, OmpR family, alkaline phosphatase synthesis response regulator PhoP
MTHRILIVDDEPNIVISLEYLMRREGYAVAVAGDGEAALQAAGATPPPDLVVLDVMLPRLSGFEVCRRLRADPRLPGLRILMLTARGGEAEVTRGADLGADAYVTKPFSTRELMARIRELLAEPR